ncbi:MAG: DUF6503 family protein [Spirosomataceae bacterium]
MKNTLSLFLGLFVLISCSKSDKLNDPKAQEIIESCVEKHGGTNYEKFDVSFDFRKYRFRINKNGDKFSYERTTKDSLNNTITDVLTDSSFVRTINGEKQTLSQKAEEKYREGTNSIAYFVMLPYKLLDKAVNLEYLGYVQINGQDYDKIKVWFDAEGGGKDHDDVFCYWINQNTKTLDYLAYDNGGPRFRKATKRQEVAGIIFQDYENYEILDKSIKTYEYDKAFLAGKAKLLSIIEQTNYKVGQ